MIAELMVDHLYIIINKIDLIEESKRISHLEKLKTNLKKVLGKMNFKSLYFVEISAN